MAAWNGSGLMVHPQNPYPKKKVGVFTLWCHAVPATAFILHLCIAGPARNLNVKTPAIIQHWAARGTPYPIKDPYAGKAV